MARTPIPRRGDVWQVSLDPTVGHEIRKTRPAVVVTNDLYNRHNWVLVVVRSPEGGLTAPSVTLPDQLRAVDRSRLVKRLGRLNPKTMLQIDHSLRMVLDLF